MTHGCAGQAYLRQLHLEIAAAAITPAQTNVYRSSLLAATTRARVGTVSNSHFCISIPRGARLHISPIEHSVRANYQKTVHIVLGFRIFRPAHAHKFKPAPANVNCRRPSWLSDTDTSPPTNDSIQKIYHTAISVHELSSPGLSGVSPRRSARNVDNYQHVPLSSVVTAGISAAWLD